MGMRVLPALAEAIVGSIQRLPVRLVFGPCGVLRVSPMAPTVQIALLLVALPALAPLAAYSMSDDATRSHRHLFRPSRSSPGAPPVCTSGSSADSPRPPGNGLDPGNHDAKQLLVKAVGISVARIERLLLAAFLGSPFVREMPVGIRLWQTASDRPVVGNGARARLGRSLPSSARLFGSRLLPISQAMTMSSSFSGAPATA